MKKFFAVLLAVCLFLCSFPLSAAAASGFQDVDTSAWYWAAVDWAVEHNITNGTGSGTFSPNVTCDRGQIVTFLWRAAGSPRPKSTENPFVDVSGGDYFYQPVLWAVEQKITNGTDATHFSPKQPCSRGQAVTFLYRAAKASIPKSAKNTFSDVSENGYYYDAVLWAVGNGVTNGTSASTFSPSTNCTRGQIVTFLYRSMPAKSILKAQSREDDYVRAFTESYADRSWARRDLNARVTSQEYKSILANAVSKLAPRRLAWFNSKISSADVPMTRGTAILMSWYAAVAMGADYYNFDFENQVMSGDVFWARDSDAIARLFPSIDKKLDQPIQGMWDSEFTAAYLWNSWHASTFSDKQLFPYDANANTMHVTDPLTVELAMCAVSRLCDSALNPPYLPDETTEYVSVNSTAATTPDSNYLYPDLLEKAKAVKGTTADDLPRLTGFLFNQDSGFVSKPLEITPTDIDRIARWGFSFADVQVNFETLFNGDITQAELAQFRRLDALVAAAIENDVHLMLTLRTLPGRTKTYNMYTFENSGEYDLYINPAKMELVKKLWKTIAQRYKDVPSKYLSFYPLLAPDNTTMSSGFDDPGYNDRDVYNGVVTVFDAIRSVDPNRMLVAELASTTFGSSFYSEQCMEDFTSFSKNRGNIRFILSFCEEGYPYAGMNVEGADIDGVGHSIYTPQYPVTWYEAMRDITGGNEVSELILDGFLPAGTTLNLYVSSTSKGGDFTVSSEKRVLYRETLTDAEYETSSPLSWYYTYATSEKKITVTLEEDAKSLTLSAGNGTLSWSGMEVVLPEKYAVDRWFSYTSYDAHLDGKEQTGTRILPVKTSTVMISPTSWNLGSHITIGSDVTYTTNDIRETVDQKAVHNRIQRLSTLIENPIICFEDACFLHGAVQDSLLAYYGDMFDALDEFGLDWFSMGDYNRGDLFLEENPSDGYVDIVGVTPTAFEAFPNLNLELLRLMQAHQS